MVETFVLAVVTDPPCRVFESILVVIVEGFHVLEEDVLGHESLPVVENLAVLFYRRFAA